MNIKEIYKLLIKPSIYGKKHHITPCGFDNKVYYIDKYSTLLLSTKYVLIHL